MENIQTIYDKLNLSLHSRNNSVVAPNQKTVPGQILGQSSGTEKSSGAPPRTPIMISQSSDFHLPGTKQRCLFLSHIYYYLYAKILLIVYNLWVLSFVPDISSDQLICDNDLLKGLICSCVDRISYTFFLFCKMKGSPFQPNGLSEAFHRYNWKKLRDISICNRRQTTH